MKPEIKAPVEAATSTEIPNSNRDTQKRLVKYSAEILKEELPKNCAVVSQSEVVK